MEKKLIKTALISVYHKDGLSELVKTLHQFGVKMVSTGGTLSFIESLGYAVTPVEKLTNFPEILGGRVKTLHPAVFGGILARRNESQDMSELAAHHIETIDLVVVDLYPFAETLLGGGSEMELIEKIDIGGISLIRAGAKNYHETAIVSEKNQYEVVANWLKTQNGSITFDQRKELAAKAFQVTSSYDSQIAAWMTPDKLSYFPILPERALPLRYGENPHQKAVFFGRPEQIYTQLSGKELSYNNLADLDASLYLIHEFKNPAACVIKHTNACGVAEADNLLNAWKQALAGDPVSAFGGIIAFNREVQLDVAQAADSLFFEIMVAPAFSADALDLLRQKKNRILLQLQANFKPDEYSFKGLLNGMVVQETDNLLSDETSLKLVTKKAATPTEIQGLLFAEKVIRNVKSNTIVLCRGTQMIGVGCGHTSRIDALNHAIQKAKEFGHELKGSVMVSDAFFPFPDCVEIAAQAGITAILQPGGSIRDELSVQKADELGVAMLISGIRHFKH